MVSSSERLSGTPPGVARPRIWLEVSREGLRKNLSAIKAAVAPLEVMAVLKANGYGFGAEALAETLRDIADAFGVAEVSRAIALTAYGLPVHLLGALIDEEVASIVAAGVIAPVTDRRIAEIINEEAKRQDLKAVVQLVVDTGMGRLGILHEHFAEELEYILKLNHLEIVGIYSHFPVAYSDISFSSEQVRLLNQCISLLEKKGVILRWKHISNSDGIQNVPLAYRTPFNLVRTGINLHGIYDDTGARRVPLQETFELKTRLVAVRMLPAGKSVGYGREYSTSSPTRIGTIPAGYADGIPFNLKDGGSVLVHNKRCPVVGRISMDLTTINLETVPEARVGDEVICLGQGLSIYEWSRARGTIPYEVICSIGARVERRFI